jgi:hypothetical protein
VARGSLPSPLTCAPAPSPPPLPAVIATKGRETDYEGVKDDVMKVLAELNVMIQRAVLDGH